MLLPSKHKLLIKHNGFTLLEVMIALAIFAIIGLSAYRVLDVIISSQARIEEHSKALRQWQRAMLIIGADIEQMLNRPIRGAYADEEKALQVDGDYTLEFTRLGWRNPLQRKRSELQRVAYSLDSIGIISNGDEYIETGVDDQAIHLLRYHWSMLDRPQDAKPETQILIQNVNDIRLRFLGIVGKWQTEWPLANNDETIDHSALPIAIELTIETQTLGEVRRIFQIGTIKKPYKTL